MYINKTLTQKTGSIYELVTLDKLFNLFVALIPI